MRDKHKWTCIIVTISLLTLNISHANKTLSDIDVSSLDRDIKTAEIRQPDGTRKVDIKELDSLLNKARIVKDPNMRLDFIGRLAFLEFFAPRKDKEAIPCFEEYCRQLVSIPGSASLVTDSAIGASIFEGVMKSWWGIGDRIFSLHVKSKDDFSEWYIDFLETAVNYYAIHFPDISLDELTERLMLPKPDKEFDFNGDGKKEILYFRKCMYKMARNIAIGRIRKRLQYLIFVSANRIDVMEELEATGKRERGLLCISCGRGCDFLVIGLADGRLHVAFQGPPSGGVGEFHGKDIRENCINRLISTT